MRFIKNLAQKNELKNLFEQAAKIYSQADDSLQPIRNVYFHYLYSTMGYIKTNLNIEIQDIKNAFSLLENYLEQLIEIKNKCSTILKENHHLSSKFYNETKHLNTNLSNFESKLSHIILDIRSFENYRTFKEFVYIVDSLLKINKSYGFKLHSERFNHSNTLI